MITVEKAQNAVKEAWDAGLYGASWMMHLPIMDVCVACNGCGPEWLFDGARDMLTKFLRIFYAAFCMHDCRFVYANDGTREAFDAANDELERNCLILANRKYGWWNPMRYVWRHRAYLVADACRDFGWSAWVDAFEKSKKEN